VQTREFTIVEFLEKVLQRADIVRIFGRGQRVLQDVADVIGVHQFHVPIRKQALAHFFGVAQLNDAVMACIAAKPCHQAAHAFARAFQPLEKNPTAEHQQTGDALPGIVALRGFDDTCHRGVIDAGRGTTAIHQGIHQRETVIGRKFIVGLFDTVVPWPHSAEDGGGRGNAASSVTQVAVSVR
jgi:hypothetical protein